MGVGNRFKKQGIPPPLDESLVTRKRKDYIEKDAIPQKKRRRSNNIEAPSITVSKTNGKSPRANGKATSTVLKSALKTNGTSQPAPEKGSTVAIEDAEDDLNDLSDDAGGIDDPDVMEDEHDTQAVDRLDAAEDSDDLPMNDDFLDDSDVVDSDQQQGDGGIWSDEDEEGGADLLNAANIEGLSRQLDNEAAQEAADAQAELDDAALQTNIAGETIPLEDSDGDSDAEPSVRTRLAPDLQLLRTRITDAIRVLDDFVKHADPTRSRAEYVRQLLKDIGAYYGYSFFLAEKLFNLFPSKEAFAFFEANETPRPVVIRTNTLRTHRRELAQSLINRGVTLEPVGKWSKVGLQVFESSVPLGATPEYLAGHYILQAASSFLPVMALAPQEGERILDMAAAPGGKTTHIAALMKNTGCIFANDSNVSRARALIGNIHRLGARNTIVCSYDARQFPKVMGGFDRVLLDAPCSGTGVIAKDASVKTNKTPADFMRLPHLQKQLLLAAIDSVDYASETGGYIVYSTCSVTVEENEQVVQYALNKRPNVKLVETGLTFGKEGFTSYMSKKFHPTMTFTRRYYPHAYNVDGFFVSKFKKMGPSPSVGAASAGGSVNGGVVAGKMDEIIDRSAVGSAEAKPSKPDEFGGWDEDADEEILARAQRNALRRKGINPKANKPKTAT